MTETTADFRMVAWPKWQMAERPNGMMSLVVLLFAITSCLLFSIAICCDTVICHLPCWPVILKSTVHLNSQELAASVC